jgi:hypothetical protein
LLSGLPATANIDIAGNVIGTYANVANIITVQGNIGNTRFLGGNVAVSGQINTLGNVVAPFFIGNGSQLTGVISSTTAIINGNSNVVVVNNGNVESAMSLRLKRMNQAFELVGLVALFGGVHAQAFKELAAVPGFPRAISPWVAPGTLAVGLPGPLNERAIDRLLARGEHQRNSCCTGDRGGCTHALCHEFRSFGPAPGG